MSYNPKYDGMIVDLPQEPIDSPIEEEAEPMPPIDALGDILAPAIKQIVEVVQCPPSVAYHSILAAATYAAQNKGSVLIDGRTVLLHSFFVTIAESGCRKSGADYWAMKPVKDFERSLGLKYNNLKKEYDTKKEAYDALKKRAGSNAKTVAERVSAIESLGPEPIPPKTPILLPSEPNLEGLISLLESGSGSVGIFSDEGGRFLGSSSMNKDEKLRTMAALNGLNDRGEIDKTRFVEGAKRLTDKRVSMHLMIQPRIGSDFFNDPAILDIGFLARCLIVEAKNDKKTYIDVDISNHPAIVKYNDQILRLLYSETAENLTLTSAAKAAYIGFHNELQSRIYEGAQELSPVRSHAEKAHDLALRIAAVLALVEGSQIVEESHMQSGISVINFSLAQHLALTTGAKVNTSESHRSKLLAYFQRKNKPIKVIEILKSGPIPLRKKDALDPILKILIAEGYISQSEDFYSLTSAAS